MTAPDVVVFPDIQLLVIHAIEEGFTAQHNAAGVGHRLPKVVDDFLLVRRHGGPRRDLVTDQAQIGLESYSKTPKTAHDNCQLARALVFAMRGTTRDGSAIYQVGEFAGPADLYDPVSNSPRYVCTMLVAARGRSL